MISTLDKISGAIVGCAAADALGALVEGVHKDDIPEKFGVIEGFFDLREKPYYQKRPEQLQRFWRYPGAYTDDTQQLLAILQTYFESTSPYGFPLKDLIVQFAVLFPHSRGEGRGFRTFCQNITNLKTLFESRLSGNYGAGSAMRAGAIGIMERFDNDKKLAEKAITQSCLTHTGMASHIASLLIAKSVSLAIGWNESFDTLENIRRFHSNVHTFMIEFIDQIVYIVMRNLDLFELTHSIQKENYKKILECIDEYLNNVKDIDEARINSGFLLSKTAALAKTSEEDHPTGTRNTALESPVTAYIIALLYGYDYKTSVLKAVNMGGDTDTVAAMTGQIVGAIHGFNLSWWESLIFDDIEAKKQGSVVPINENAERSIPLEWFCRITRPFQLLFFARQAYDGVVFDSYNYLDLPKSHQIWNTILFRLPFIDNESVINNWINKERKIVRSTVRFMKKNFNGAVNEIRKQIGKQPNDLYRLSREQIIEKRLMNNPNRKFIYTFFRNRVAEEFPEYPEIVDSFFCNLDKMLKTNEK